MAVYALDEDAMLQRDLKGTGTGSSYGILNYYTFTNRSMEGCQCLCFIEEGVATGGASLRCGRRAP